ncbi:MAG: phosphoenolpyruvate carboxykinase (ATP), partial [Bacteroidota bacterium]
MKSLNEKSFLVNLQPAALVERTIKDKLGKLSSTGALVINTGKFTGRSPKDRFIVKDSLTEDKVDWGNINIAIEPSHYQALEDRVMDYVNSLDEVFVRDAHACANPNYRLKVRVYTEFPWQSLFVYNMFVRPTSKDLQAFSPDWQVFSFPGVMADPEIHGTRQENFAIINFSKKTIIIGGTAYTGEIKKGIFSVLNFILPTENNVLPMHCSANVGSVGDTSLFFGLSGTGKTTL